MQEQAGGLGSLLALWGPLIIVGFLVLVFRGGDEPESQAAAGFEVPSQVAAVASGEAMRGSQADGAGAFATGALPTGRGPGSPPGTERGTGEIDGGFTMRTSMAGTPTFPAHRFAAEVPTGAGTRGYPPPPGPYRDPRYRSLPTGESWSAADPGHWMWPARGPNAPRQNDGGEAAPAQWVPCAPPYYWCPAPSSPAW